MKTKLEARYWVADRAVHRKFFEDPVRGFKPYEVQQIVSLRIGERIVIREYHIQRLRDQPAEAANTCGWIAAIVTFATTFGWVIHGAVQALSSRGWLFFVTSKISGAINGLADTLLNAAFGEVFYSHPSTFLTCFVGLMLCAFALGLCIGTAVLVGEFTVIAVDDTIKGETDLSRYSAALDLGVPPLALIAFALCRSAELSASISIVVAALVILVGLAASHQIGKRSIRN